MSVNNMCFGRQFYYGSFYKYKYVYPLHFFETETRKSDCPTLSQYLNSSVKRPRKLYSYRQPTLQTYYEDEHDYFDDATLETICVDRGKLDIHRLSDISPMSIRDRLSSNARIINSYNVNVPRKALLSRKGGPSYKFNKSIFKDLLF